MEESLSLENIKREILINPNILNELVESDNYLINQLLGLGKKSTLLLNYYNDHDKFHQLLELGCSISIQCQYENLGFITINHLELMTFIYFLAPNDVFSREYQKNIISMLKKAPSLFFYDISLINEYSINYLNKELNKINELTTATKTPYLGYNLLYEIIKTKDVELHKDLLDVIKIIKSTQTLNSNLSFDKIFNNYFIKKPCVTNEIFETFLMGSKDFFPTEDVELKVLNKLALQEDMFSFIDLFILLEKKLISKAKLNTSFENENIPLGIKKQMNDYLNDIILESPKINKDTSSDATILLMFLEKLKELNPEYISILDGESMIFKMMNAPNLNKIKESLFNFYYALEENKVIKMGNKLKI